MKYMKSLKEFVNEAKNPAKGGFKSGDKLWVLTNRNNYKNPIELTIKSVTDVSGPNSPDEYRLDFDNNDADIKSFEVYTGNEEYDELYHACCHYFTGDRKNGWVIFGRSKEDLKDSLESRYGEEIKELTKEINDKQEEMNVLQQKLLKLLYKINID